MANKEGQDSKLPGFVYLRLPGGPDMDRLSRLLRHAHKLGCDPVNWFSDLSPLGAHEALPELTELLGEAEKSKRGAILVERLSVLGQSLPGVVHVLDRIHRLGLDLVAVDDGIDTTAGHKPWS